MALNFREALVALARAASAYLSYAALLVFAGLLVLVEFGMALFVLRLARIAPSLAAIIVVVVLLVGGWLINMTWQRLFLFRRHAVMLCLFSGTAPDKAQALAGRMFPSHSAWVDSNRRLRRALIDLGRHVDFVPGVRNCLAAKVFSPGIFVLAFACGYESSSLGKALALYWRHGQRTRSLEWRWLKFSALGLVLLFICLALPSWVFFSIAGAPQLIGIALAAVIAMFLHQAFLVPLALAGVSASLLDETRGQTIDSGLASELSTFFPEHESSVQGNN